jgi:site-specific DNA-methyltransferase (adenine-specific)
MRTPVPVCEVVHADAAEYVTQLEPNSFDALVTDPPFGIGYKYNDKRESHTEPSAYWLWLQPIYTAALRAVRPGGLIAVWQSTLYMPHLWQWFGQNIHVYIAAKNFVQVRRRTPINYGYDPIVMFYKAGDDPLHPPQVTRNLDFFVANTAAFVSKPQLRPEHPCPRPIDQCLEIVENFTRVGARVLDTFAGSGSIGVACAALGRHYVGIERESNYVNVAWERIRNADVLYREWRKPRRGH